MKTGFPDQTPVHLTGTCPEPGSSASTKSSEGGEGGSAGQVKRGTGATEAGLKRTRRTVECRRAVENIKMRRPDLRPPCTRRRDSVHSPRWVITLRGECGALVDVGGPGGVARTVGAPSSSAWWDLKALMGRRSAHCPHAAAPVSVGNAAALPARLPRLPTQPKKDRGARCPPTRCSCSSTGARWETSATRPASPPACIWTLPDAVSSGLRGRCLEELPVSVSNQNQNQNHTLRVLTAGCACEFLGGLRVPPNSTACAAMLQGCGGGGGGVAVAVGLSLLLLAVAGGVGCVWHWKHRGRAPLALPGFLRRRRRRRDYSKTLSAGPKAAKAPAPAPHPGAGEADPQDHYENLPAGAPGAPGLYENARRGPCEEHVYGNEAAGDYYNFQAPGAPASPQDEDIYILPDAY
ncbi:LOW QUALITY PROTEIN: hypothetical protein QTO34_014131 [Cnephaeus nilssonii]|uniref:Uncharacterized protein n=1 Tax=Cnephaeus nilssonii TaxID=3371016 RepID=A0AA40LVI8_CNENI|nr:LOW QUALITY PROTEIN: hypothetical protein QTO34_014131 [Eptesicus nilssonii]